jgi:hypothetical protein
VISLLHHAQKMAVLGVVENQIGTLSELICHHATDDRIVGEHSSRMIT